MGQRTAIILKKNFGNNRSTISVIHHQWGIGKVMPSLLLQEVLKEAYPLDRSLDFSDDNLPIDNFYTFKPLNNSRNNYVTDKEVKTDDPNEDIWNAKVRVRYGNMTDNNNGLMLVEVTQNYDSNGKPKTYGNRLSVKIGFALGDEEITYYNKKLDGSINIEPEFVRLVSIYEYAVRTFGGNNEEIKEDTKKYIRYVKGILDYFGIEQVFNRKGESERNKKEEHINRVIEGLTRDLPQNTKIPVPDEFKTLNNISYT